MDKRRRKRGEKKEWGKYVMIKAPPLKQFIEFSSENIYILYTYIHIFLYPHFYSTSKYFMFNNNSK